MGGNGGFCSFQIICVPLPKYKGLPNWFSYRQVKQMIRRNIRNIIFDFGGVICDLLPERCRTEFQKLGCSADIFPKQYSQFEGIFQQLDRGTISTAQFYDAVRCQGGIPNATDKQIREAWTSLLVPIQQERFEMLNRLRRYFNLYILSNANDIHWQFLDKERMSYQGEHITGWFKQIFLSYKLNLEKPEPKIFQTVIEQAGIKAEESLFLDDSQLNLEGAAGLGIQTLLTKNGDWVEKLASLLP